MARSWCLWLLFSSGIFFETSAHEFCTNSVETVSHSPPLDLKILYTSDQQLLREQAATVDFNCSCTISLSSVPVSERTFGVNIGPTNLNANCHQKSSQDLVSSDECGDRLYISYEHVSGILPTEEWLIGAENPLDQREALQRLTITLANSRNFVTEERDFTQSFVNLRIDYFDNNDPFTFAVECTAPMNSGQLVDVLPAPPSTAFPAHDTSFPNTDVRSPATTTTVNLATDNTLPDTTMRSMPPTTTTTSSGAQPQVSTTSSDPSFPDTTMRIPSTSGVTVSSQATASSQSTAALPGTAIRTTSPRTTAPGTGASGTTSTASTPTNVNTTSDGNPDQQKDDPDDDPDYILIAVLVGLIGGTFIILLIIATIYCYVRNTPNAQPSATNVNYDTLDEKAETSYSTDAATLSNLKSSERFDKDDKYFSMPANDAAPHDEGKAGGGIFIEMD